uniref:Uncharacterized protein n=1 Tax=Arundo donax TaxID=35708 RepID=A0A0A9E023_ARUDO
MKNSKPAWSSRPFSVLGSECHHSKPKIIDVAMTWVILIQLI